MDCVTILAQAVEETGQTAEETQSLLPVNTIWQHITSLHLLEALMFVAFGVVCLFYGWRIFKMLVVICFGLIGLALGWLIATKFVVGLSPVWGGVLGLVVLAGASIPLMRWAVSVLGLTAGGALTGGAWYAFGLSPDYIWAGFMMGAIAGGMISFIIFKISVMLFSSLGGSTLVVTGLLALLYMWPQSQARVEELVLFHTWFLPLALTVPTAAGLYTQNRFIKGASEWSV